MLTRRTLLAFLIAAPLVGIVWRKVAAMEQEQDSAFMRAQMLAAEAGSELSAQTAQKREGQLAARHDDLLLRAQLLGYYLLQREGIARQTRRKHILWLVQHAPGTWITGSIYARLTPHEDASALPEARQLWKQQVKAHPRNAQVLGNAAAFFTLQDANEADCLYREAQTLQPANPHWAEQRGLVFYRRIPFQSEASRRQTAQQALAQFEIWDRYAAAKEKSGDYSSLTHMAMAAFEAAAFDKARRGARCLLDIAVRDTTAGNSMHHGNLVLGRLALHDGDTAKAREYLLAAGRTPGSPQLDSFGPNMTLAKDLLVKGECQAVLEYFALCRKFWNDAQLEHWTTQVKNGEMPDFGGNLLY